LARDNPKKAFQNIMGRGIPCFLEYPTGPNFQYGLAAAADNKDDAAPTAPADVDDWMAMEF
jgi:hypothetical protein